MRKSGCVEDRIQAAYAAVPGHIREDLYKALQWAREVLTRLEGEGHEFRITAEEKPECFAARFLNRNGQETTAGAGWKASRKL